MKRLELTYIDGSKEIIVLKRDMSFEELTKKLVLDKETENHYLVMKLDDGAMVIKLNEIRSQRFYD